ncbi:transmembrane protein 14C-like [Ornithodoros turicata]|uniref:transmembrane protein 14C-like n=1 Tax=Ornithodoros turicata TaxID=34597 RepID=UPI003139A275
MNMDTDYWSFGYALAVVLGGIMGYVKAGSMMSLLAGVLFGGLALIGAYQTSLDPKKFLLSIAVSALLSGLMGYRYIKTSKLMPAGLVAVLSIAMCCRILCRAYGPSGGPVKQRSVDEVRLHV